MRIILIMKRTEIICDTAERDGFTDVTDRIGEWAAAQDGSGLLHLFLPHTTAGLVISDRMDTVTSDVKMCFSRIFPEHDAYVHRSPNSDAHIKSVVCGCQLIVPVENGRMLLGQWQRIFVVEGDGPKSGRRIICTYSCGQ